MPYIIATFDGINIFSTLERGDMQNMGAVVAITDFVQLPSGEFWDNYGDADSPRELTDISKSGVLYPGTGGQTVEEQLQVLRAKGGHKGVLEMEWAPDITRWTYARVKRVFAPRGYSDTTKLPVDLTWAPAVPIWYAEEATEDVEAFSGVTTSADLVTDNAGDVNVTDAVLRLLSPFTGVLNITLENYQTAQLIEGGIGINAGDTFVLDVANKTARVHSPGVAIGTISRSGNVITVNTTAANGLAVDDEVLISGTNYDGFYTVITDVDSDTAELEALPNTYHPHGPQSPVAGLIAKVEDMYQNLDFSDEADWLHLVPGSNTLHLTSDQDLDTGSLTITYFAAYG